MNVEQFRDYCIAKKGVTESFPFDNDTLVFKVMNKMFALLALEKKIIKKNWIQLLRTIEKVGFHCFTPFNHTPTFLPFELNKFVFHGLPLLNSPIIFNRFFQTIVSPFP